MGRSKQSKKQRRLRGINHLVLIDQGKADFKDLGCIVWPSCLDCPLPRCVLEMPHDNAPTLARAVRILQHRLDGRSRDQIIAAEQISRRTYYRILERLRAPIRAA